MTLCYRQMSSQYWHFLGDLLHTTIPCEDIAFPTGMANPGNRNRCSINPDWIIKVQLLRLNLSVWRSCDIPVVHTSTLGLISKKSCRKEVKVVNELHSGYLFWYQCES